MTDRRPRIDAHHHLWDLAAVAYDWPTAADGPIFRSFAPDDLAPELAGAGIDRTIVVQAADSLDDTDAMIHAMAATPWIAGIVGWAPLTDTRAASIAIESRLNGGLRGIRHLIHREADPDWLVRTDVRSGLAVLASYDLAFDVVARLPAPPPTRAPHRRRAPASQVRHRSSGETAHPRPRVGEVAPGTRSGSAATECRRQALRSRHRGRPRMDRGGDPSLG